MDPAQVPLRRLAPAPVAAALAVLAATWLRTLPLLDNRFHPDEALYAYFGRLIASGRDPLLAGVLVDKPPLSFYLTGLSAWLVGPHELAARLPEFFASLVSIALIYALGRRLYGSQVGVLAAWLLALSPFAILFAITVFVDPLLTAAGLWSLWAAAAGRWRTLGAAVAIAFAIKQTALVYIPLALALAILAAPVAATPRAVAGRLWMAMRPLVIGLAIAAAVIFGWDLLRQPVIGFWDQGYSDNLPGRLVRATEVMPRARAWIDLSQYVTGSMAANVVFLVGLPVLLLAGMMARSRAALADYLLALFLLVYLAGYWLLAFNVWDRYLLPVLPLGLLLLARVAGLAGRLLERALRSWRLAESAPRLGRWLAAAGLAIVILPQSLQAARSTYPVGGDHGAYDGIDEAALYLRRLPPGTVLYDHWLSWEWNYYLFDGPIYVSWFSAPEALTADLQAFGSTSPRYLAVPSWETAVEVEAAASAAGYELVPVFTAFRRDGLPTIVIYELRCLCPASEAVAAND